MSNAPMFAPQTIHDDAARGRRVVQVIACGTCPATHEFRVNTRSGGMADETVMRKARLLGWDFRRHGRDATCSVCVRGARTLLAVRKLKTEPEAMRAALTVPPGKTVEQVADAIRLEAVLSNGAPTLRALEERIEASGLAESYDSLPLSERLEPEPEPEPMKPTLVTTAPRQPSREDKRRVLDKLNDVYDGEETGYSGDWSDEKVAATLSVPPAWVRDLRVEFHGENAGNAASDKEGRERKRAINELRSDLSGLETRFLTALADFEKAIGPLKARLARLDGES